MFFIVAYFFYASFFAAIGAVSGSESDGQQFVLPIIAMLLFSLIAGYFAIYEPDGALTKWTALIPFTAPMVVMVKLAMGYADGDGYQLFISLGMLIIFAILMHNLAARWYKNGILKFGHRLSWLKFIKLLKKE